MQKFKVGDIVKALPDSDEYYGITCHRNNFVGYVTKVYNDEEIEVADKKAIESLDLPIPLAIKQKAGYGFIVCPRLFQKIDTTKVNSRVFKKGGVI